jgi:hypothetical protein
MAAQGRCRQRRRGGDVGGRGRRIKASDGSSPREGEEERVAGSHVEREG